MSLWRQMARGLRALTHRQASDRDIADEVDAYLEQAIAELIARGLSPAEARRAAQLQFGNRTAIRNKCALMAGRTWQAHCSPICVMPLAACGTLLDSRR